MFKTIVNAFKMPDLRKKMLFVLMILLVYRLGAVIPVPFVNSDTLAETFNSASGSIFQYLNIMSGEAFSRATLFALSVQPYITASIVMQLLTIAIPALERLQSQGEEGRKKITTITRYVTVGLGLITSYGYYAYIKSTGALISMTSHGQKVLAALVIIACYSAGSALVMWMAEKINEFGIGNGISLILFANILSSTPRIVSMLYSFFVSGRPWYIVAGEAIIIASLVIVVFVVFVTNSERRIPVQYAKKVVGRKMYGGQSSYLPIKLNMSGVMPIIFASSIISLPTTLALIIKPNEGSVWDHIVNFFSYNSWFYPVAMFLLIIAFAYFYVEISFNPVEVANNLQKNGGSIRGIRPGRPTVEYIRKVRGRITLIGALFLDIVAVLPIIVNLVSGSSVGSIAFGGSSLLIIVGVALETVTELEAQMTMRHYKGFLD